MARGTNGFSEMVGGCEPAAPAKSPMERVRALLGEVTGDKGLTPEDYRYESVVLRQALTTTTTTGSDEYRAPSTHHFVINDIRGHISMTALGSETLAVGNIGNPSFLDRILIKSGNCKLELKNNDRSQKLFENHAVVLSTILPMVGGDPIDLSEAPHILPAGETLHLDISFQDAATAAVIGGSTEYGVVLSGWLVRQKRS